MKLLRRVYSIYAGLIFIITFFLLFPLYFILIQKKKWHKYAYPLNKFWAKVFFTLCFIPVEVEMRANFDKDQQYIFCANHFSYLDIPIMGFTPIYFVFVGKSEMASIPMFGYMYRKLHITVNRQSRKSSYNSYVRSKMAIDEKKSLVIFPEGGIVSTDPPKMGRFKDGAFRTSIEKQIPIIPVTIPFNWIILPDDEKFLPRLRANKVIFHEPIETKGLSLDNLEDLKHRTFDVIEKELYVQNIQEEGSSFENLEGSMNSA
ncbi:1-acyl-sn-glycerol-3-phosphate acyltransferase [Fulvivirgaceae bacterium BMA10]|uniref:1-acyl-sn-glycerol-3-phosphate acyltransferase n=1 Tax=Splendidivirga corallicola TaxID=3051826 RepID=A0ABT8KRS0_9BACT|nr:1-acyl-sn-glycerol-3-phosphate acyltransferase [Fulvivirgaceae bacterium BMA10]